MDSRTCGGAQFFGRSRPPLGHGQHPYDRGRGGVGGGARGGSNICYNCGQPGHWARDCRRPIYEGCRNGGPARDPGGRTIKTCFTCGGLWHFQSECPSAGAEGQDKQPIFVDSLPEDPFSSHANERKALWPSERTGNFFHPMSVADPQFYPLPSAPKTSAMPIFGDGQYVLKGPGMPYPSLPHDRPPWAPEPWVNGERVMAKEVLESQMECVVPSPRRSVMWTADPWNIGANNKEGSGCSIGAHVPPEISFQTSSAGWTDPWANCGRDMAKDGSIPQTLWGPPGGASLGFSLSAPFPNLLPDGSLFNPSERSNPVQDVQNDDIVGKTNDETSEKDCDEDVFGLTIDDRVEQLMAGFELILGKEKEVVFEALRTASRRVNQEFELGLASEDSPQSHGAFGEYGEPWRVLSDLSGEEAGVNQERGSGGKQDEEKNEASEKEPALEVSKELANVDAHSLGPESQGFLDSSKMLVYPKEEGAFMEETGELWKWPLRGGDWKLEGDPFLFHAPSDKPRLEARKVVLSGGRHLWEIRASTEASDPRIQAAKGEAVSRVENDLRIKSSEDFMDSKSIVLLELPAFASSDEGKSVPKKIGAASEKGTGNLASAGVGGTAGPLISVVSDITSEASAQSHASAALLQAVSPSLTQGSGRTRISASIANVNLPSAVSSDVKTAKCLGTVKATSVKGMGKTEGREKVEEREKGPATVNGRVSSSKENGIAKKASIVGKASLEVVPLNTENAIEKETLMVRKRNATIVRQYGLVNYCREDETKTGQAIKAVGKSEGVRRKESSAGLTENTRVAGSYNWSDWDPVSSSSDEEGGGDGPWDVPLPVNKRSLIEEPIAEMNGGLLSKENTDDAAIKSGKKLPEGGQEGAHTGFDSAGGFQKDNSFGVHQRVKSPQTADPLSVVKVVSDRSVIQSQVDTTTTLRASVTLDPSNTSDSALLSAEIKSVAPPCNSSHDITYSVDSRQEASKKLPEQVVSNPFGPGSSLVTAKGERPCRPIHEGEWFYQDGMGKEQGGCLLSRLQWLVKTGQLVEGSSVYRREDALWLPITSLMSPLSFEPAAMQIDFPVMHGQASTSGTGPYSDAASNEVAPNLLGPPVLFLPKLLNFSLPALGAKPASKLLLESESNKPTVVQESANTPPVESPCAQNPDELAGLSTCSGKETEAEGFAIIQENPLNCSSLVDNVVVQDSLLQKAEVQEVLANCFVPVLPRTEDSCNPCGEHVLVQAAGNQLVLCQEICSSKQLATEYNVEHEIAGSCDRSQSSPSLMAFVRGKLFEVAMADYRAKILQALLVDILKCPVKPKESEGELQGSEEVDDQMIPGEEDRVEVRLRESNQAEGQMNLDGQPNQVKETDAAKADDFESEKPKVEGHVVVDPQTPTKKTTEVEDIPHLDTTPADNGTEEFKVHRRQPKSDVYLNSEGQGLEAVQGLKDQSSKEVEFSKSESSSQSRKRPLLGKIEIGTTPQRRRLVVDSDSDEDSLPLRLPAHSPRQTIPSEGPLDKKSLVCQMGRTLATPSTSSENGAVSDSMESTVAEGWPEDRAHKVGKKKVAAVTPVLGRSDSSYKGCESFDVLEGVGRPPAIASEDVGVRAPWESMEAGLLNLIFCYLKEDAMALASIGAVCRAWRGCGLQWRQQATKLDLKWLGNRCSGTTVEALLAQGYGCNSLERISLDNCTDLTQETMQRFLACRPSVLFVEVTESEQMKEVAPLFPKVQFVWSHPFLDALKPDVEMGSGSAARTAGWKDYPQSSGEPKSSGDSRAKSRVIPSTKSDGSVRGPAGASPLGSAAEKGGSHFTTSKAAGRPSTPGIEVEQRVLKGKAEGAALARTTSGTASWSMGGGGWGAGVPSKSRQGEDTVSKPLLKGKGNEAGKSGGGFVKVTGGGQLKGGEMGSRPHLGSKKFTVERLLEREIGEAIKKLLEWDKNKFFTQPMSAGLFPTYEQRCRQKVDLSTLQRKLRDGEYSNASGLNEGLYPPTNGLYAFDNDVKLIGRNAFLYFEEKGPIYKAGQGLFKLGSKLVENIKANILKQLHASAKLYGGVLTSKAKGKRIANNVARKPVAKKREREEDFKGRAEKKKRDELDDESDLDSDAESEEILDDGEDSVRGGSAKKGAKSRNVWSESEGEESEEDGTDLDIYEYPEHVLEQPHESASNNIKAHEEDEEDGDEEEVEQEGWTKRPKVYKEKMRLWGNRMTKAAMVPPITRVYETIENYVIVEDKERVERKLVVELPDNLEAKTKRAKDDGFTQGIHLDWPDVKPASRRQEVNIDVVEQEVYGIDPCTHNQLLDSMREQWHRRGPSETRPRTDPPPSLKEDEEHAFIEERVLCTLNRVGGQYTGRRAPMELDLVPVVEVLLEELKQERRDGKTDLIAFCEALLAEMRFRQENWRGFKFRAYRKGLGVVCKTPAGIKEKDFVVEFIGEIYPPWRWFEKQDGIRKIQNKESVTEFYNIYLERPRKDQGGFDVLVVDAMHKANFASRLCHSCRPNCEAKVVAVEGSYMIGVYSLRDIKCGEELTFDYASVTESMEEYNQAVCLCGDRLCKGSYLSLGGHTHLQHEMMEQHGILRRHWMLLDASTTGSVTLEEREELRKAGLGWCLLSELPDWAVKYAAYLMRFINQERRELPRMILQQSAKELRQRRRKAADAGDSKEMDTQEQFARNEADGVYMARLQNLAITMDKVRYCLRKLYGESKEGPPPLQRLSGGELLHKIWSGDGSVVNSLFKSMAPHQDKAMLHDFYRRVQEHAPGHSPSALRKSLLWLRDELLKLQPTALCRFDAAADLFHMYAYTDTWFTHQEYPQFDSPPLSILASDLGRSLAGRGVAAAAAATEPLEWYKTYERDHILGQLIHWYKQTALDPGKALPAGRRGCLVLPDPSSCFSKSLQQPIQRAYGSKQRNMMFERMVSKPERGWPKASDDSLWEFRNSRSLYGSPMLDAIANNRLLNAEMMAWLRKRPITFVGPYDTQC